MDRPLGQSALTISAVDPNGDAARWCLQRYFEELSERFAEGFEAELSIVADPEAFAEPRGIFLVATIDGRPVGCGGVTLVAPDIAYIKRMWVDGSLRGIGLGRRMLAALEDASRDLGCDTVRLETNRALIEAIRMYRTSGYQEVDAFNDEHYAHHWFEKRLDEEDDPAKE